LSRYIASAAAVVLMALASAHAEAVEPQRIAYDMKMSDDSAAKACILVLSIKVPADETVDFELVVARMKRDDVVAGPAVFGFTIIVRDWQLARRREAAPSATELTSAVFISARYTAAARPRTASFADGSWVASTLDPEDGGELLEAAASGKFQIAYTRTRPTAARVFEVISVPPLDVLMRFTGCVDGLHAIE
jgi:hypothetical protein